MYICVYKVSFLFFLNFFVIFYSIKEKSCNTTLSCKLKDEGENLKFETLS